MPLGRQVDYPSSASDRVKERVSLVRGQVRQTLTLRLLYIPVLRDDSQHS